MPNKEPPFEPDAELAADLGVLSQELEETQDLYETIAYLGSPKMPCMECGGQGSVGGGSLGDICPRCNGARVEDHPGAEQLALPDFAGMRLTITAVGEGRLPPADLPKLEDIRDLRKRGKEQAKLLAPTPQVPGLLPAAPQNQLGSLGDEPDEGPDDDELDELEQRDD